MYRYNTLVATKMKLKTLPRQTTLMYRNFEQTYMKAEQFSPSFYTSAYSLNDVLERLTLQKIFS